MIPYAWFMALEAPDGQGSFASADHLERYGFIPADSAHPLNPDGLPIGFAIDPVEVPGRGRSLGPTCAACHTASVTVEDRPVRIDGAPGRVDFDRFYADLATAVHRTLFHEPAFKAFARRILGQSGTAAASQELRRQLEDYEATLAADVAIRRPALESGFGRVDALNQIVNALAVTGQSEPRNLRAGRAPVSYPQLWLAPELEAVQWIPIARSPINRNAAEVLGVFGTANLSGERSGWYSSSVLLRELHAIESWVVDLKPPPWDETVFGPIDRQLAAQGGELFGTHCAGCHNAPPYAPSEEKNANGRSFIKIGRVDFREVGTDPAYVISFIQRLVHTNPATAAKPGAPADGPLSAAQYFSRPVGRIIEQAMLDQGVSAADADAMNGFRRNPPDGPERLVQLKASPLPGTWATGPFLHNGSVPTVYELLSPVAERRAVFWTGGRELDRQRLGYVSEEAPGRFRFDTSLPGNGRAGHLYPKDGLTPDERMAIIEYLKTL
jgi:mono/diheme cytochrome c family protein